LEANALVPSISGTRSLETLHAIVKCAGAFVSGLSHEQSQSLIGIALRDSADAAIISCFNLWWWWMRNAAIRISYSIDVELAQIICV